MANAILKRLLTMAATISPQCVADLKLFVQRIAWDAKGIPVSERLAPRLTKPGTLDLTAGRLFATTPALHAQLVEAVRANTQECIEWVPGRKLYVYRALHVLLASFHSLHATWVVREPVTNQQLTEYSRHVENFAHAWRALSWKGTVWVHWVVVHSAHLLTLHRTISAFSSIPSEHKHTDFKVDVRHSFAGGRDRKRYLTSGGVQHVVEKNALDIGLELEAVKRRRVV